MDTNALLQGAQAVAAVGLLGTALGALLGVAARHLTAPVDERAQNVTELLPGSNCAQCGFAGCAQAATAIVEGRALPTACPPGGVTTAQRIAQTLGLQLDLADAQAALPQVAYVNEARCIGCTRCIRKCTADAIVGAAKQMHTILPEACHACELCATECPTDAIEMKPVLPTLASWHWPKPTAAATATTAAASAAAATVAIAASTAAAHGSAAA